MQRIEKEFEAWSLHQQLEFLFRFGKAVATRQSTNGMIRLIQTPFFLAEARYKADNETIYRVDRVRDVATLAKVYPVTSFWKWLVSGQTP